MAKPSPELAKLNAAVAALAKIEARCAALVLEQAQLVEARVRACDELASATRAALAAFGAESAEEPPPAPKPGRRRAAAPQTDGTLS